MAVYKGLSGKSYQTQNAPFAGGGEGDIYDIAGVPDCVAKLYKSDKRTTEREHKLSVMVSNKPNIMGQYAWPLDVLYENGQFIGYIMPKINGKEKLRNIYVYDNRKGKPWSLLIAIAKNLSAAVHNVHEIHQVVGDLNPENILVNPNDGMVTLVDTDSYHISDYNRTYRCGVGMEEFVAPELQGIHFPSAPLPTFTPESDCFALAVLVFALLMNGSHPFSCKTISGSSSKFQPIDNIKNGKCAFFPETTTNNMDIPPYAPDLNSLPQNIQQLFRRAFVAGHRTPALRPSAEEWYNALEQLEKSLKDCSKDIQHIYYNGAKDCPWCKVNKKIQSVSNNSRHSSIGGTILQQTAFSGFSQQFTPRSYKYTPSSTASRSQSTTKKYGGLLAVVLTVIIAFICVFSFFHFYLDAAGSPVGSYRLESITNDGKTETAEEYARIAKLWKKMGEWKGSDYDLGKLALNKDGTGIMTIKGDGRDIAWNDESIILLEVSHTYPYTLEDDKLTIAVSDITLVFLAKKNTWIVIGVLLIITCLIFINHNKNHIKLRNLLIVMGAVIIGFAIVKPKITTNQNSSESQKASQTKAVASQKIKNTTLKAEPGETFSVPKYVHKDLNVHEKADINSNTLFSVSKDSLVYVSDKHKDGVVVKIKFDDNHIGWVNGTYLRDFKIISVQLGNHDDNGNLIGKWGDTLYASQIKHLAIKFDVDTKNNYDKKVTVYLKIISPYGYMQGKNTLSGYSVLPKRNLDKNKKANKVYNKRRRNTLWQKENIIAQKKRLQLYWKSYRIKRRFQKLRKKKEFIPIR